MHDLTGQHQSLWIATTPATHYSSLQHDLKVDVVILGGGIAGLSSALFLKQAGLKVAVIESHRIALGTSGHTTAKITSLHNLIYTKLSSHFDEESAFLYGQANQQAIEKMAELVDTYHIDCDFTRAPAYVYTEHLDQVPLIEKEVEVANRLGLPATLTYQTELPLPVKAAIQFSDQAHFHARKYLLALANLIDGNGSYIFEETRALDVTDGTPCTVKTQQAHIQAEHVIVATHEPFLLRGLYFARMYPNRSYAVGALLKKPALKGMYLNLGTPVRSFRSQPHPEGSILIIGGEDHQTGKIKNTQDCYHHLETDVKKLFDVESIKYYWSAQDNMTLDQVPYIGQSTRSQPHIYVATGFNEWGMTHGTVSGLLLCDQILNKPNPYTELYSPARHDILSSPLSFASHNLNVAKDFVSGHLSFPEALNDATLAKGEGKIVRNGLKKIAAYRDEEGHLHCYSATCPHLGCIVEWNQAEKTWDCPCHGSRFSCTGRMLEGPAVSDLTSLD